MNSHVQKAKEAEQLDDVSKVTIAYRMTGRAPMLVHDPCYNDEVLQDVVTGLIQITKPDTDKSDHPSNFVYQCRKCKKQFVYE